MGILNEDIQAVRDRADIVQEVGRYVQLKKDGQQFVGLCPFHAEKSGSFKVQPQKGLAHCFGCKWGGDVIAFVQEIEKIDFPAAVEMLAGRAGVHLRYEDTESSESARFRARLYDLVAAASDFYQSILLDTDNPEAKQARLYLKSRGIDGAAARRFGVGWAPERSEDGSRPAYDRLSKHLKASPKEMVAAGLGFEHERYGVSDAFRGRVMFTIHDPQGRPIAFGGRLLPGVEGPKYKNSAEGPLYSKSRVLYGMAWAKASIVRAGEAVVCEGYTDVISFHAAGVDNTVATCGTALTEDHVRLLRRHAPRIVLAFDADAAGGDGMERMHQWERHHSVEAAVAVLPAGEDPDGLARRDPEAAKRLPEAAVPLLRFRVDRAVAAQDTSTPEGRARAADAALAVLDTHPDPIVRDSYLPVIAAELDLDPALLRGRRRGPSAAAPRTQSPSGATIPEGAALAALRVAVHRPDVVGAWLDRLLFPPGPLREAFDAVASNPETDRALVEAATEGARPLLTGILVEGDRNEDALVVASDLAAGVVRRALSRAAEERRREGADPVALLGEVGTLAGWLDAVQSDRPDECVLGDVVAWAAEGAPVAGAPTLA